METTVSAPVGFVERIAALKLPDHIDDRVQELMDKSNGGKLSECERADLTMFAELSEELSRVRADALHLLWDDP
jgi:hypothetical protein